MNRLLAILFVVCVLSAIGTASIASSSKTIGIRGGLVPQADDDSPVDYYEKFELDYGSVDRKRIAGAMRGFLPGGRLSSLAEDDPFLKWLNEHLEKGPDNDTPGRLKPFAAVDFGTKEELKQNENPKIIIVQRTLKADKNGTLKKAKKDVDVEVREIWQPWLKARCNFAIRYIVPNRVNIIKIMESKGRFISEVEVNRGVNDEDFKNDGKDKKQNVWAKMTFKPSLTQRASGSKDTTMWRQLPANELFGKGPVGKK